MYHWSPFCEGEDTRARSRTFTNSNPTEREHVGGRGSVAASWWMALLRDDVILTAVAFTATENSPREYGERNTHTDIQGRAHRYRVDGTLQRKKAFRRFRAELQPTKTRSNRFSHGITQCDIQVTADFGHSQRGDETDRVRGCACASEKRVVP